MLRLRALLAFSCLAWVALSAPHTQAHEGLGPELSLLDAQLAFRPHDVELLVARAALLRRASRLELALTDCDRALSFAPAHRPALVERGLVLAALGRGSDAEAALTAFLASGPPSSDALATRARVREASGRLEEARADLDAAIALGGDPELYLARGRLDEALGKLEQAAVGYEEGVRTLGGAWVLRAALIRVERRRGRPLVALFWIDEASAKSPSAPSLQLLRAEVLDELGRGGEALAARKALLATLEAELAKRPNDLRHLARARTLLALGRHADAKREVQAVLSRAPGLVEAQELAALLAAPPQPKENR